MIDEKAMGIPYKAKGKLSNYRREYVPLICRRLHIVSVLKLLHFETLKKIMEFFKSPDGQEIIKSGFHSAGISGTIQKAP